MLSASRNPIVSQGLQPGLSCRLHPTGVSMLPGWSSNDCSSLFSSKPDKARGSCMPACGLPAPPGNPAATTPQPLCCPPHNFFATPLQSPRSPFAIFRFSPPCVCPALPLQPVCNFSCPTLAAIALSDAVGWRQAGWIKAEPSRRHIRQGPGSSVRGRGRAITGTSPCTAASCLQKQASKAGHKGCCRQPCNLAAFRCLCAPT